MPGHCPIWALPGLWTSMGEVMSLADCASEAGFPKIAESMEYSRFAVWEPKGYEGSKERSMREPASRVPSAMKQLSQ